MEMNKPKILSIIAYDRSGTTFLGKLLNRYQGTFFLGEIDRGIKHYYNGKILTCACGQEIPKCEVWGSVLQEKELVDSEGKEFYNDISSLTKANLLIDSSKGFKQINYFNQTFSSNQLVIHLIRNPKGVIFSRMKTRKRRVKNKNHPKMHIAKHTNLLLIYDSLEWCLENIWMEIFKKKKRQNIITAFYDNLEEEYVIKILPFLYENTIIEDGNFKTEPDNHILFGNINRYKELKLPIKVDNQWREGLTFLQRMTVDLLTFPVRLLFNYKFKK